MIKKNGFTIIEFIVSFSLVSVVVVLLLQLLVSLNNSYSYAGIKTEMLVKQANIIQKIQGDLSSRNIKKVVTSGNYIDLNFYDGTSERIEVRGGVLYYGKFQVKLVKNSIFKINPIENKIYNYDATDPNEVNAYLAINISFSYPNIKENFDIKIVKLYNNTYYSINN